MSKKVLTGVVVSDKMEKTAVVKVERTVMHPIYKKFYKVHKKFAAHDDFLCKVGDLVKIQESRPLSKTKKWIIVEIFQKSKESLA